MKKIVAAVLGLASLLSTASYAPQVSAQVAYIPANAPQPRFGGEFALTEVGPVVNFWPTVCYDWHLRANSHRTGPKASPEMDAAFKRFIKGLIIDKPAYDDLTPAMAEAVKKHMGVYWTSINRMGYATVAKKIDTDAQGRDEYVIDQTGGETHWNVLVDQNGKIDVAFLCAGTGL